MKELSNRVVAGLYALQRIAQADGIASSAEIAGSARLPEALVEDVLQELRQAGLIQGVRGHGYELTRPAGTITALDVFQALQAEAAPTAPCGGSFHACDTRACCPLMPICREAEMGFRHALRSFTIDELKIADGGLPPCSEARLHPKS